MTHSRRIAGLAAACIFCQVTLAAASPTEAYLQARDRLIAELKPKAAGAFTDALNKEEEADRRSLEQQLLSIIGPFSMPQMPGPAKINLDTLITTDEGFGMLDGLVFTSKDEKTKVFVTTVTLLQAWLKAHKDWWKGVANVPQSISAAVRTEAFYTQAISTDAAVSRYVELTVAAPPGADLAFAMLGLHDQDVGVGNPDELFVAVRSGERIMLVDATLDRAVTPAPACQAGWKAAQRTSARDALAHATPVGGTDPLNRGADAYRACFAKHVRQSPTFAVLIAEAQALVDRLPRP